MLVISMSCAHAFTDYISCHFIHYFYLYILWFVFFFVSFFVFQFTMSLLFSSVVHLTCGTDAFSWSDCCSIGSCQLHFVLSLIFFHTYLHARIWRRIAFNFDEQSLKSAFDFRFYFLAVTQISLGNYHWDVAFKMTCENKEPKAIITQIP